MPPPSRKLRLLFMGTPDFAVDSLKTLAASGHEIVSVITAPDKPKGRGLHVAESPVKQAARTLGLPMLQPVNLKDPAFFQALKDLRPDLIVIVAFRILPMAVVELPPLGAINLHGSLLPAFRGAAPIPWAVVKGEKETGVTVFFLNKVIDGGDIIRQEKTTIGPAETGGELTDRLKILGAKVLKDAVNDIAENRAALKKQDETKVSPAPKIRKQDGKIDFTRPARVVYNLIRGMAPRPGAFAFFRGKRLEIAGAQALEYDPGKSPGSVTRLGREGIDVQTGKGTIRILRIKPESRKEISAEDFVNGYQVDENDRFE